MVPAESQPPWQRLFDGGAAIQPPLGPRELADLPARRGVFFLEGADHAPILLATAANIRSRMRYRLSPPAEGPSRRADLREVAACVRWKLTDSHFETDWQFLELARAIYPRTYPALLGFQPAWFVHVDPQDACPWPRRTREVFAGEGQFFGPFRDKHAAQRFIEILQDVFDLCRCEQVLRQAPHGVPCVYAQIGRCRVPCAGGISLDQYRQIVAEACRCAAGDRETIHSSLTADMIRLSRQRQYEQAANCKLRLARLEELGKPEYRCIVPAERFAYVVIQRGPRRGRAKTFLVDRGAIRRGPILAYPPPAGQLAAILAKMGSMTARARRPGQREREIIGLVSHYLFVARERRGLAVRYELQLTAERLAQAIESAADDLRLRPARLKRSGRGDGEAADEQS